MRAPISCVADCVPDTLPPTRVVSCMVCRDSHHGVADASSLRFAPLRVCAVVAQVLQQREWRCPGCNWRTRVSFEWARTHIVWCSPFWWRCEAVNSEGKRCSTITQPEQALWDSDNSIVSAASEKQICLMPSSAKFHSLEACRTYSCRACQQLSPKGQCIDKPLLEVRRHLASGEPHRLTPRAPVRVRRAAETLEPTALFVMHS